MTNAIVQGKSKAGNPHVEPALLCKKFIAGLFVGSALWLHGAIVTNTWTGAAGGSWTDAANWSDPVMIGTNAATCAFFDLSALATDSTVSIPYLDGGIRAYGLRIGSDDGVETDTWLINKKGTYPSNVSLLLSFQDDGSGVARLDVHCGVLRCDGQAKGYNGLVVVKDGAGSVRLVAGENGNWWIADGAVVPCNDAALWKSAVRLTGASGLLDVAFESKGVDLVAFRRNDNVTEPMPLNGGQIFFGAAGTAATLDKDFFSGTGTISSHGDQVLTLASPLPSFAGAFRLENGDITMKASLPGLAAWYAFEDASNVGAASHIGPALVANGSLAVVSDATRGNVLSLDGTSYLAHADAAKLPEGFPFGSASFTIGFWVKPAADVDDQATLFYLGKWEENRCCLLIRLEKAKKQLLFTNYGNNTPVNCEKFYDGNWHHLAVRYESGSGREELYLDGAVIGTSWITPEIKDGEFWIGTGKNDKNFKGLMDDFVVSSSAIDVATLVSGDAFSNLSPKLNSSVSIVAHGSGTMNLSGTQTVAQISGDVPLARIRLDGGLKVTGTAEALSTTYPAEIAGAGDLVKDGANYDLTLSGVNTYTGVTRVVAGTLGVKGRKTFGALAGRWTFEDAANLGHDSGDFGFDLDVTGATAYADETRGNVVKFGGKAKLSSTALPDVFPTGNSDYTLSLWLKGETSCAAAAGVCVWGTTGTDGKCALWRLDGTAGWMMTNWGDNHTSTKGTATTFRDGTWHHVVWVRKSSQRSVYVDGALAESWNGKETIDVQKTQFTLGMNPASGKYFTGCMDDVRLYAFALTEAEAKAEYAGAVASSDRSGVTTGRPDPVYRWTFDDADDPWANTGTATGGALTAVGMPLSDTVDDRAGRVLNLRGVQASGGSVMSYLEATEPLTSLPSTNRPFTVSCWARMTYRSDSSTWVYWGGEGSYFMLFGLSYNGQFRCTTDTKGLEVNSGVHTYWAPDTDNKWRHFAATYDGEYLRIYEDGNLVNKAWVGTIDMDHSIFWIGRKASSTTDWFHGYLDDVEVYDAALSNDQIVSIVRDERNRATEPVLPASAVVEVSEGATFRVEDGDLTVSQVKGAGSIAIGKGATLGVTAASAFSGTVTGYGTFGLPEGVTIETDKTLAGLPILSAPQTTVTIPATGTVRFNCAAKEVPKGVITLATGASVAAPTDLSGWKVEPALRNQINFRATPTAFELQILPRGFMIFVR